MASCVAAARENARQVRQHISGDMWAELNSVHLALNDAGRRRAWSERPHQYFQTVREGAALFDAAVNAGLARDEGWHFLQLGLFLERAGATARLLACQMREAQTATVTTTRWMSSSNGFVCCEPVMRSSSIVGVVARSCARIASCGV